MATAPPGRWCYHAGPLPDLRLSPAGPLGRDFLARGMATYRSAARYVHLLPYGRTADPDRYASVLVEGRGTCSGKHTLLAALAEEHRLPVELRLGLYAMDERNTPGVGPVLRLHGLDAIPEAHCYLACREVRVDLTRTGAAAAAAGAPVLLHEERIRPAEAGRYKREVHLAHIGQWAAEHGLGPEAAWRIREACVRVLSHGSTPP